MICHCTPYLDVSRLRGRGDSMFGVGLEEKNTQQVYFPTNVRNDHHPRFQCSNCPKTIVRHICLILDIEEMSNDRTWVISVIDKQVS